MFAKNLSVCTLWSALLNKHISSEQTPVLIATPYLHIKHFFHLSEEQTYYPVDKPQE